MLYGFPITFRKKIMKQDYDLLRKILLDIEALPPGGRISSTAYDLSLQPAIVEHMMMLDEAGFATIKVAGTLSRFGPAIAFRLTHEGHTFLRQIRDDSRWSGIKKTSMEKGLDLTIEVVKSIAGKLAEIAIAG